MFRLVLIFVLCSGSTASLSIAQNGGPGSLPNEINIDFIDSAATDASEIEKPARPELVFEGEALLKDGANQTDEGNKTLAAYRWSAKSIDEIDISLTEDQRTPKDRSTSITEVGRGIAPVSTTLKTFAWQAPNIKYQPLYFEDVALERYGQTLPAYRQTVKSAWHMTRSVYGLLFQIRERPIRSCDYPLGYCRPGNCVPQTTQRHFFGPWSWR